MTSVIYEKAQILADAIANSTELAELRRTEKEMLADEQAQKIIEEFQNAQARLAELQESDQELTEEDNNTVSAIENKVEQNPLISAYLAAQDSFTEMLDSVNSLLANAIAGDSANSCSSCAATNSCSTNSCGCSSC